MTQAAKPLRLHPAKIFLRGFGTAEGIEWGLWLAATVYWLTVAQLSVTELVVLGVVLEATVIISETPTGVIADVRSRRQSLIIAQVLMGLSFLWTFASDNIWMLLASHALLGFGWTFRSGADVAWITDELLGSDEPSSDSDIQQLLLRRTRFGMVISLIVGPLTIALGWFWSVRAVGLLLSVAYIVLAIWLALVMPEEHFTPGNQRGAGFVKTLREGIAVVRSRPRLRTLILVAALLFAAAEVFGRIGFFHLLETAGLRDLDGSGGSLVVLGVLFFVTAVGGIVMNAGAERSLEGGGEIARVAGLMLVLAAVGGMLVATSSVVVVIGLGFLLQVSVEESMYPVMEGWANRDAPSEVRATVHSIVGQTVSLSQIAGAVILGSVAAATSVRYALGAAACLIALSAVVALRSARQSSITLSS